jgi:hypothetical protein
MTLRKLERELDLQEARMAFYVWGCKPEPQKIPSRPLQPHHDHIQVDDLPIATEVVVPIQVDVSPSHRRNPLNQCMGFRVTSGLERCE